MVHLRATHRQAVLGALVVDEDGERGGAENHELTNNLVQEGLHERIMVVRPPAAGSERLLAEYGEDDNKCHHHEGRQVFLVSCKEQPNDRYTKDML